MNPFKRIASRTQRVLDLSKEIAPVAGRSRFSIFCDFLSCWMRFGSNEEDYKGLELYKKSSTECNKFTTSGRNFKWLYEHYADQETRDTFDDKCNFNSKFAKFIKHEWISTREASIEEVNAFIDKHGTVIVKPSCGCEGIGVYKLRADDRKKRQDFIDRISKNKENNEHYVVEEVIRQHPDMAYLNESSVNTCRIETVTDKEGKAHIINTIVIMGGVGSTISNTHSGGVMCHVDPDTGIIDSKARNPEGKFYLRHPGNGALLIGRQISYWKEVLALAVQLAEHMPKARYIGWDIPITPDGPDVIEGNLRCGHCTQACDMVGRWPLIKKYL